jgi:hypothetical protein
MEKQYTIRLYLFDYNYTLGSRGPYKAYWACKVPHRLLNKMFFDAEKFAAETVDNGNASGYNVVYGEEN